ncbi:localization factor PodJL [Mariprofundus micogutta]|uniref:Localization factor PodJL n=1 Tax=Mariprofundus micogutta TaxID=1921010 RepID=A0A1L8CKF6_9PROT|nr:tetratricopeptide repeat protein [Mariprofundus micogutta]GAV19392.1 localization factor PodJL [Mariprofundus micogutta]
MFKRVALVLITFTLLACSSEQPAAPAVPPTTHVNDPAKDIADQAMALAFAKEFDKAAPLFREAAEQGNRPAQYYLGLLYGRGDGVEQSYDEAFKWLYKAGMGGHPKAAYHLGEMHVKGEGVEVSHIKALAWFWVGTTLGDRYSETRLRAVAPRLTPDEMGKAKAMSSELMASIPHDMKVKRKSLH